MSSFPSELLAWILAALGAALTIVNGIIAARWEREAQQCKNQLHALQAVRQAEQAQAYARRSAASKKGWQTKAARIHLPLDTPPATT